MQLLRVLRHGWQLYILCVETRNGAKQLFKRFRLRQVCDISSTSDVKSFASNFSSKDKPVHILVNNAGLLENNRLVTSEGFEMNFAVNVLGTYTMTELMLPFLEKAAPDTRVINVASGGMYTSPLTDDLQFSGDKFDGFEQYARNMQMQMTCNIFPAIHVVYLLSLNSIAAQVLLHSVALTEKWADKYKHKGIGFYSMHPGWAETPGVATSLPHFSKMFSGTFRTMEEGAGTIIWLALQPKAKLVSGRFYLDRAEAPKHLPFAATKDSHVSLDSIVDRLHSFSNISP